MLRIGGLVAIALSVSPLLLASDADTQEIKEMLSELSDQLDDVSTELADEYLEILDRLNGTIEDYTEYFEEFDDNLLLENNLSFRVFLRKMRTDTYLYNPKELQDDIHTYVSRIGLITGDHIHISDCRESCQTLTNLRRELSILAEYVDDYLSTQTRERLRQKEMFVYLQMALMQMIDVEDAPDISVLAPLSNSGERSIIIEIMHGSSPSLPSPPDIPAIAGIEAPKVPSAVSFNDRAFFDSLNVNDQIKHIRITNPVGDLRITGWNKQMISASLQIEVASLSRLQVIDFLDNTTLKIDTLGGDYIVLANFPVLDNMKTRLTKSSLVIRVPNNKTISASSSFGQISIADLQADVTVKGHHSEINIDNIVGATQATNSSGEIRLTNITGAIFTECSYGAIEITSCVGTIQSEHTYSDLSIFDCAGSANLSGSGNVFIQGFFGLIDISNSYGPVEIRDVEGSLVATNAYDILIVRNISGSATLENSYARISAYKIGGPLNVTNSNGTILAEGMEGPMTIENEAGDIRIVLDHSLGGNSTIVNSNGTIDVAFLRRGDFVLNASTFRGRINSHLALHIEKDGDTKSTAVTFGRGLDSVLLLGNNTVINISEVN